MGGEYKFINDAIKYMGFFVCLFFAFNTVYFLKTIHEIFYETNKRGYLEKSNAQNSCQ